MFSGELTALLGQSRNCNDAIEQHHFDIAASLQEITESYLISAVKWLKSEIDCPNLCLSGGVIMNSVFNGRIAAEQVFENIYVPFAPDDSGNSIGAALWTAFRSDQYIQQEAAANPFLGRAYTDAEIENQLEASNLRIEPKKDIITTADLLDQGKIVGWFQGRMEFGQRALGARSILADPRKAEMKERINKAVKFREPFRPFAPAILAERTLDWFEIPSGVTVPYMEKVFRFKSEKRCLVPSVVQFDGSGRLQMVDQSLTPQFHSIIKAFEKLSGIPILLNTSFNINNEPVVESPIDAIRTFYSSGLDAVAIGSFLIQK